MDRREAIMSLTTVLGYAVTPATIVSISSACSPGDSSSDWVPEFFIKEDASLLENLAEAMLPETDTPGAIGTGAHIFADRFLSKVGSNKDLEKCKKGLEIWKNTLGSNTQSINMNLSSHFNIDQNGQEEILSLLKKEEAEASGDADKYYIYSFLMTFKRLLMLGYFASEEIGENVLSYLPVPGKYEGCVPVENVGHSWAL